MPAPTPPRPDHSPDLDELAAVFDRAVAGYYWAIEAEEWSAAWEYLDLIDLVHQVAERAA